eukprot:scaffold25.g5091.t1
MLGPSCSGRTVHGLQASVRPPRPSLQFRAGKRQARAARQRIEASMGIGFVEQGDLAVPSQRLEVPQHDYGLSVAQMRVLGLTNEAVAARLPAVRAESLTAKAFYVGDNVPAGPSRQAARMAVDTKAPGQAPPDLPSLLLDGRICYIGMALVPAVTELVISELLWLNYAAPDKPIYVYINSTGSQTLAGEAAFGNAAMILASGKKGFRYALPNSRIMTCPPRINSYVDFMAMFTGRDKEAVRADVGRNRYFTPQQAIEYGIIDRVVAPCDDVAIDRRDYEGMLRASQAGARGRGGGGAMAGTEA